MTARQKKYRELRRKWRAPIARFILTGSTTKAKR